MPKDVLSAQTGLVVFPFASTYIVKSGSNLLTKTYMKKLTELCFEADNLHLKLFNLYANKLGLKLSGDITSHHCFLYGEGFIPSGEMECYPVISYALSKILTILIKLKITDKKEVHQHLREFYDLMMKISAISLPVNSSEEVTREYLALKNIFEKSHDFLLQYAYKLEQRYINNSSILSMCVLYESVKLVFKRNLEPHVPVVLDNKTRVQFSLAEVAEQICSATAKKPRDIQFIALGISESGTIWATTNYHTPVIYTLDCLLSNEMYLRADRLRERYKVEHRNHNGKELIFTPNIHAETMIAALREALNIRKILLIDGEGRKIENCAFCSHYLCSKGFTSQPHMQEIKNYQVPTQRQLDVVTHWTTYLMREIGPSNYSHLTAALEDFVIPEQISGLAQTLLIQLLQFIPHNFPLVENNGLEQIFNLVRTYYPFDGFNDDLKTIYHHAIKMAYPNEKGYSRSFIRGGAQRENRYPNTVIRLFDDGSLKKANRGNRVEPERPDSPRSCELSNRINTWLEGGDASVQFVEQENRTRFLLLKR